MSSASFKEPNGHVIDADEPRSEEEDGHTSDEDFLAPEDDSEDEEFDHGLCDRQQFGNIVSDSDSNDEPPPKRSKGKKLRHVVVDSEEEIIPMSPVIVPISPVVPAAPKAKGKPQQGPLSKHWSVTHNNYPAEWDAYTEEDFKSKVAKHYADHFHKKGLSLVYVCAGKEVAPTTGTRHMQMYLVFEDKRRATQLIKAYPALSYDISRGTPQQNEDYCSGQELGAHQSQVRGVGLLLRESPRASWDLDSLYSEWSWENLCCAAAVAQRLHEGPRPPVERLQQRGRRAFRRLQYPRRRQPGWGAQELVRPQAVSRPHFVRNVQGAPEVVRRDVELFDPGPFWGHGPGNPWSDFEPFSGF
jgi:hypothetical protein